MTQPGLGFIISKCIGSIIIFLLVGQYLFKRQILVSVPHSLHYNSFKKNKHFN